MKLATRAEDRLVETVLMVLPNYQPGWATMAKPRRKAYCWSYSTVIPVTLVALVFFVTQSGLAPYRDNGVVPHHGSYCLLFIAVALSRRIGDRGGALVAMAISMLGLFAFANVGFVGSSGAGWLVAMGVALTAVGFAADLPLPSRGGRSPKPPQNAFNQGERHLVVGDRASRSLALS